jgi:hypothetical protein
LKREVVVETRILGWLKRGISTKAYPIIPDKQKWIGKL